MTEPSPASVPPRPDRFANRGRSSVVEFFSGYFWFIFKNVIGWIFILASPVLGITIPGPGGIPVFLIGFAPVTFPASED